MLSFQFVAFAKIATLSCTCIVLVSSHGRLMEPPGRSSLFKFPEFKHLEPAEDPNDNALYCGGRVVQHEINGGKCGICGDSYNDTMPRAHEDGGEFGRGIIVRGYRSGETIPVHVELTAAHRGYFQFRLCAKDDLESHLDETCYEQHVLQLSDGSTNYKAPDIGAYNITYEIKLPKGISCKHCVLQWHYHTGNDWNICEDGTGALGCGPQETFRACSDITIYPEGEEKIERYPNSRNPSVIPESPDANTSGGESTTELTREIPTTASGFLSKFLK